MRGVVVRGDGLEVIVVELVEMEEQFRQITLQIFVKLMKQLIEVDWNFRCQIPMEEMEVRALVSETVRYD